MSGQPIGYVVRVLTASSGTVGVGVLLDSKHLITCAHVVNAALGREKRSQPQPTGADLVDLELALPGPKPSRMLKARVVKWLPPLLRGLSSNDLAGLEIVAGEFGTDPAFPSLSDDDPRSGTEVQVFGYPEPRRANGGWAAGKISFEVGGGLLQLNGTGGLRIQSGYSGGPVVSEVGKRFLGLLAVADSPQSPDLDSYLIPSARIRRFWPETFDPSHFEDVGSDRRIWYGGPSFFDQVLDVARARHPQATITEIREDGYLRLTAAAENDVLGQWPVGVVPGDLTTELLAQFRAVVHDPMAEWDPYLRSVLVYGGAPAEAELVQAALESGIKVQSLMEYQQLVDLRTLLEQQAQRIDRDPQYATAFYVPQRYRMVESTYDAEESSPLLAQVARWVKADSPRFIVLLGDFGTGKTFLMRELARKLPKHLPALLVELKDVEKAPDLDTLLSRVLNRYKHYDANLGKLLYMVKHGRVVLLVDGFDELALRVSYDHAANYLRTLIDEASDGATVVLTSRRQHFISDGQVLNAFGGQVAAQSGSRIAIIEKFDDEQIREFLVNFHEGAEGPAREHFAVLAGISHLLELAANPQMLAFIAAIEVDRLREIQAERGRTSKADIYREVVDSWLEREVARQGHRHGIRSFDQEERRMACVSLALRMWQRSEAAVSLADLKAGVVDALPIAPEQGYQQDEATHAIGSGSLLIRTDDEKFVFVHQSVLEYLVAAELAARFEETGAAGVAEMLGAAPLSDQMVEFLCDLVGPKLAMLMRSGLFDSTATDIERKNAFAMLRELDRRDLSMVDLAAVEPPTDLSGLDLRNVDLTGRDLRGASLRGANLAGMRIAAVDFSDADLTGADFTGAQVLGGSLVGADLARSTWYRAALAKVGGAIESMAPELDQASVVGRDRAEVMVKGAGPISCLAISPAEDLLAVGRGGVVEVVDLHAGVTVRVLPVGVVAMALSFSRDGKKLVIVSRDGGLWLWDVAAGGEADRLSRLGAAMRAAGFFLGGELLVTVSDAGIVQVWDVETRARIVELDESRDPPGAVGFSADGRRVAIGFEDGVVRIWDLFSGQVTRVFDKSHSPVWAVGFSADGRRVAIGFGDGVVRIRDMATGRDVDAAQLDSPVWAVGFSADGKRILTGSREGAIRIWDVSAGRMAGMLAQPGVRVGAVGISLGGDQIAASSSDGIVRIWDVATGQVSAVTRLQRGVGAVGFTGDDAQVVIGYEDGSVRIWDPATGGVSEALSRPSASVRAIAFSADGRKMVTSRLGGRVQLWNVAAGKEVAAQNNPDAGLGAVGYSADGRRLATTSKEGAISIWNAATGEKVARLPGLGAPVLAIGFSFDGKQLATGSYQGTVQIWDVATKGRIGSLVGHAWAVRGVSFFPDGRRVLTCSDDGTTRIWDVLTGKQLAALIALPGVGTAVLLPDGSYKLDGDPGDSFWWAIKQCRFAPGELDPYVPEIRRLAQDAPILP